MIESDYTGHHVKVAGWGRVKREGATSRFLREATLKVMSWATCSNTSFGEHLTESMMCAYSDNTDACQVSHVIINLILCMYSVWRIEIILYSSYTILVHILLTKLTS